MNKYFPDNNPADSSTPNCVSDEISAFLEFLRSVRLNYQMALSDEEQANTETQDILHSLELKEHTEANKVRLADALRRVRRARRDAKDTVEELQPIIKLLDSNASIYNHLERLLGDVRKVENKHQNRFYVPRTDIVELSIEEEDNALETDFEGSLDDIWHVYNAEDKSDNMDMEVMEDVEEEPTEE